MARHCTSLASASMPYCSGHGVVHIVQRRGIQDCLVRRTYVDIDLDVTGVVLCSWPF